MSDTPKQATLFLVIAVSVIFIIALVWLVGRASQRSDNDSTVVTVKDRGPQIVEEEPSRDEIGEASYYAPSFLQFIPSLSEHGDHSTIPHGHEDEVAYSNIVHPDWLEGQGCNLFDLDIFDADCDGIPNWLEDFHETDGHNPEDPYHQGAWNYDGDGVIHGMDGHYSCDMYPDLLNCNRRTLSNDETINETQNTDEGCVPDVIEIVRGTNPLDPTDDHNQDIYGRIIPTSQCQFNETTLNDVALSELPSLDSLEQIELIDENIPPLSNVDDIRQIDNFDEELDDFTIVLNDINTTLDLLDDYQEIDLDESFLNVSDIDSLVVDVQNANGVIDAYGSFLESAVGSDFYAASEETFVLETSQSTTSFTCEEPGSLYIPYPWDPVPTTPQDIRVTMSDAAGNTSDETLIQEVGVDTDRWVLAIDRQSPDRITDAATVDFRVFFNYEVSGLGVDDFVLRTTESLVGDITSVTQASGGFEHIVTIGNLEGEGLLQLDFSLANDIVGPNNRRLINPQEYLVSRQSYIIDRVDPEIPSVASPTDNASLANPGRAIVNCPGAGHEVIASIVGVGAPVEVSCEVAGPVFVPLPTAPGVGPYDVLVRVRDPLGRVSPTQTISDVTFRSEPVTTSITRQSPSQAITNSDTLMFRVTFSDPVDPVDVDDFTVIRTGTIQATIESVTPVSGISSYDVEVSTGVGSGLVSLFLTEDHDIIEFATDEPVLRDHINERQLYRVDKDIPERPAIVRPSTRGTSGSPTGIVVQCMSGDASILYEPLDMVFEEYVTYADQLYTSVQSYVNAWSFEPINQWRTRHDVRFEFDLETSTWDRGWAVIRGWVDTQGLTIRPELRYTQVQGVPYVEQFERYCVEGGRLGFQQANFEDGGWIWDLMTTLFNAGQYERVPVFAYFVDPATGELVLEDEIQTEPGVRVPFVASVPYDAPNNQPPPPEAFLQTDGLYAFAIVDPEFVVPLSVSVFGFEFEVGIPVPVQLPTAASFIFTGPGCFDIFNKQVPTLTLDLETSSLDGGEIRPQ
jgi:hypothetical protein